MKYCIYWLLFLLATHINAQNRSEGQELLSGQEGWSKGSIMLNEGEELKGLVRYDDRNGILSFHDGENSKAFTPRTVVAFEFTDEITGVRHVFYSLPYEDQENGVVRPQFFEMIREFRTFTLLLKTDPITIAEKTDILRPVGPVSPQGTLLYDTKLVVSQAETIYLMNLNNEIKPYLKITSKQDGHKSLINGKDTKTRNKIIDEDLFATIVTKPVYQKLLQYSAAQKLSFEIKDELLKILDYYETIDQ